jgi:hypothetical protein
MRNQTLDGTKAEIGDNDGRSPAGNPMDRNNDQGSLAARIAAVIVLNGTLGVLCLPLFSDKPTAPANDQDVGAVL